MEYIQKAMTSSLKLKAINGISNVVMLNGYFFEPSECPICKRKIKPNFLFGYINIEKNMMYLLLECLGCNRCFIKSCKCELKNAFSVADINRPKGPAEVRELDENSDTIISPNIPNQIVFSDYIINVSSKFVEIYNQAYAAECYSLNEIAGIGYRKSIEFLIKDFLSIGKTDEEKEAVKTKALAQCISQDINNANLKIAASRAVWIGNDETHYIRKHTDKDITDLKRLIDLTVRWIEMECMTKEAEGIPYIK